MTNFEWFVEFKQEALIQRALENLLEFQTPDVQKKRALQQLENLLHFVGLKLKFAQFNSIFKGLVKTLSNYHDS